MRTCFAPVCDSTHDSWEGMAKSTAVRGNPGSSVQIRGWAAQAAQGDAPRGGHFPQGLLKE